MDRSRVSVLRSAPPLWLLGVCLFLPTVRACERMTSPAELVRGSDAAMAALLSPYLVAELLCIVVVVALAARLTRPLLAAAAALTVGAATSPVMFAWMGFADRDLFGGGSGVAGALALLGGMLVLVRARRRLAWERLAALLRAYTLFALPLGLELLRVGVSSPRDLGPGGWLTVAAVAALAAIALAPRLGFARAIKPA